MTLLRVQCGALEPKELQPGDTLELHRRFVTGGDADNTVSRRGHAAMLFDRDGDWFVYNRSSHKLALVNFDDDRTYTIRGGAAQPLTASYSELHVGGTHRIGLTLHIDARRDDVPGEGLPTWSQPDDDQIMEDDLAALFKRKPKVRRVTLVRFQNFIPGGRDHPSRSKPLTAAEVALCHSGVTEQQVNQIQRDIKELIGLDADNLGPWLVERGLLHPRDRIGLPHDSCGHRPL